MVKCRLSGPGDHGHGAASLRALADLADVLFSSDPGFYAVGPLDGMRMEEPSPGLGLGAGRGATAP